ncbi:hypothetical protein [Bacillus pumilus]|uniref:hypothetical protein n=1 Tax=Bacillus pumilus TaxID=1408 RepID=UPI00119E7BDA|nr:hypothetical protein [Bacillus pumilus]
MKREISICIRMIWEAPKKIKEKYQERKRKKEEDFSQANLKKNLMGMRPRVFVEYIDFHFPLDGQIYKTYKSKLKTLRSLDEDVLSNAIARTKGLEKIYETKYVTSFVIAMLTATVPTILAIGDFIIANNIEFKNLIKMIIRLVATLFAMSTVIFFQRKIIKDKNVLAVLVSFRELLEQALAKKHEK